MAGFDLSPLSRRLLAVYIGVIIAIMYIPMLMVALASISRSRFFIFPIKRTSFKWYEETWSSLQIQDSFFTSLTVAACVAVISVILAFFGALAYARYEWKGRSIYQQVLLIPVFFPQAVLGLALQLWFNSLGIQMSWQATVFAQLVWIVPIVTLIIAIQAYGYDPAIEEAAFDLGASRWQIFRDITLPLLGPGIFAGFLFAILLSWGNFPLAYFTSGADVTVPEWLYGKMIGGYTPMVPAVGLITVLLGAAFLVVGLAINAKVQRQH
ncbi:MAG: ABC transporter permease [Geminicoccales bacterium]